MEDAEASSMDERHRAPPFRYQGRRAALRREDLHAPRGTLWFHRRRLSVEPQRWLKIPVFRVEPRALHIASLQRNVGGHLPQRRVLRGVLRSTAKGNECALSGAAGCLSTSSGGTCIKNICHRVIASRAHPAPPPRSLL